MLATTCICFFVFDVTLISSFLLDANSSFTALTSKEFDQLLDLIVEEKKSRYQLEHYVGILENRYTNLVATVSNLTSVIQNLTSANLNLKSENHILAAAIYSLKSLDQNLTSEIHNLKSANHNLTSAINNLTVDNTDLHAEKKGLNVGFTVRTANTSSSTILGFTSVIYDPMNSYNITTGKFVCQYPGLYLFAATIGRASFSAYNAAWCDITLNGVSKTTAVASGEKSTLVLPSGTATYVGHLDVGDEVYLSHCYKIAEMAYTQSSLVAF